MKNKLMRLASAMLVLTLLSTCAVSGTYAKYVTEASASDTARVAKFGVQIATTTNSLFATSYTKDVSDTKYAAITNSVNSSGTDSVVAPGTSKSGSTYFNITGTPEVAVEISYGVEIKDGKEPVVPAGTYKDWTTADTTDNFTTTAAYYPVKFTLKQGNDTLLEDGTLTQLQTVLQSKTIVCPPNTNLATLGEQSFTLSWAWDFEDSTVTDVNKLDTLLGQVAAGVDTTSGIVTDLNFDLTVTVTQID